MILDQLRGGKQPSQKLKLRDSQMELLRIVAMSMILIHHFVVHGSPYSVRFMEEGLGWQNAFVFYGVNLFVLISGFYGIKVRWRSFLSLLITLFLFAMVDFLLKCGFGWYQHGFDASDLTGMVRVLIHPFKKYWFISCYLVLYIFAPVINLGLKHATKAQLRTIVLIAMGYCIYGGLVFDYAVSRGYEIAQFMLLYITGYWLNAERPFSRVSSWTLVLIAVGCSVINGSGGLRWIFGPHSGPLYTTSYINVFCFVGSVVIFLLFTRFSFRSRIVNSISAASFGCYLLQDGRFGEDALYAFQSLFYQSHPLAQSLLMYTICFIGLWVASWGLTWFKNLWAPKLIDAICRALPERWKQAVW